MKETFQVDRKGGVPAVRVGLLLALGALGCSDDGGETKTMRMPSTADPGGPSAVTWHQQIAPLVIEKCGACHRPGGIAPFSVRSYEAAKPYAAAMAAAVEQGTMPPFLAQDTAACVPRNKWKYDIRATAEQKALLRAWAEAGAPLGDPATAARIAEPVERALPREDVVVLLPAPIVVEKTERGDIHTCVIVDPKLTKDEYVVGRHIHSGNDRVLHHLITHVLQPRKSDGTSLTKQEMDARLRTAKGVGIGGRYDCFGGLGLEQTQIATEMLGGWAPGVGAKLWPEDAGYRIAKDSLLVMDIHYHPHEHPERDEGTKLTLMLADKRPGRLARILLLGNVQRAFDASYASGSLLQQPDESAPAFVIPAGKKNHVEEMRWKWKLPNGPLRVFYAGAHMHYVGRDMTVRLHNATPSSGEPERECLVRTPQWNFNWQGGYEYDAPYESLPVVDDGDTLELRCVYDNSLDNPYVREALNEQGKTQPLEVTLGEDTLNEMCIAVVGIVYPNTNP